MICQTSVKRQESSAALDRKEKLNLPKKTASLVEDHEKNVNRNRLYRIWNNIKVRCLNQNSPRYKDYGGRGITICNEWLISYQSFRLWSVHNGYKDSLCIDRIDNNGGYHPSNCRWVTFLENGNNTRKNIFITHGEVTKTLSQWSRHLKINYLTLYGRIFVSRYSIDVAFSRAVIKERDVNGYSSVQETCSVCKDNNKRYYAKGMCVNCYHRIRYQKNEDHN